MAFVRRTNLPKEPTVQADLSQRDDRSEGRSNDLQGIRYDVYNFIEANPGCTRDDVSKGLSMKSSTATARVKELIDLGYVMEPYGMRKLSRAGVMSRCLVISDRPASGKPLDRVQVRVELTIDCNGVYGANAYVINGKQQHGKTTSIAGKIVSLVAPPPDLYAASIDQSGLSRVSRLETQANADEVIDGSYIITTVD